MSPTSSQWVLLLVLFGLALSGCRESRNGEAPTRSTNRPLDERDASWPELPRTTRSDIPLEAVPDGGAITEAQAIARGRRRLLEDFGGAGRPDPVQLFSRVFVGLPRRSPMADDPRIWVTFATPVCYEPLEAGERGSACEVTYPFEKNGASTRSSMRGGDQSFKVPRSVYDFIDGAIRSSKVLSEPEGLADLTKHNVVTIEQRETSYHVSTHPHSGAGHALDFEVDRRTGAIDTVGVGNLAGGGGRRLVEPGHWQLL